MLSNHATTFVNSPRGRAALGLLCLAIAISAASATTDPTPKTCCVPAIGVPPDTPPVGATSDCLQVFTQCGNRDTSRCSGKQFEDSKAGYCKENATTSCTPPPDSGRTAAPTVRRGTWTCKVGPFVDPCCQWVLDNPVVSQPGATVGQCTGGGCP